MMNTSPHLCIISTSQGTYGLLADEKIDFVGGAELQQKLIAEALLKRGYKVSFLVHDFGQPDVMVNSKGITLIKTFGLKNPDFIHKRIKFLRIIEGLAAANADVYYFRGGSYIIGLISLWCKFKKRRFIFGLAHEKDVNGDIEKEFNFLLRFLYRLGIKYADAVVAQTEIQQELLKKNFKKESILIRNIYEIPASNGSKGKYALWVSNFLAVKRPKMLLEVARDVPEIDFYMIGGPRKTEPELFEEAKNIAHDIPNVRLLGPVPYSDVGKYYEEALLHIHTSEMEGFPNSYLDAWARRVPVVATYDPDEILCKYKIGLHCNTVEELASAVRKLIADESLRREIGDRGRKYIEDVHSSDKIGEQYDELIKQLTKTK